MSLSTDDRLNALEKVAHIPKRNSNDLKELRDKLNKGIIGIHKLLLTTVLAMIVVPTGAMYFVNDHVNAKVVKSNEKLTEQIRVSDSIKTEIIIQYRTDNAILRKKS